MSGDRNRRASTHPPAAVWGLLVPSRGCASRPAAVRLRGWRVWPAATVFSTWSASVSLEIVASYAPADRLHQVASNLQQTHPTARRVPRPARSLFRCDGGTLGKRAPVGAPRAGVSLPGRGVCPGDLNGCTEEW